MGGEALTYLIALLPLLFLYRFRHTKLDRDYAPYCIPVVFGIGYLKDGHHDIKPPLIHWSYKVWYALARALPLNQMITLRLLPAITSSLALLLIGNDSIITALVLSLLLISPTLWVHMANTEWLTVLLLSLTLATTSTTLPPWLAWVLLGLLPFINQKNVLLLVPVVWALGLQPNRTSLIALCTPGTLILAYLTMTGRLKTFIHHVWTMPNKMGKGRTLKQNTLGHLHLLKPGLILMAPWIACLDLSSPWSVVFACVVAISLWSKQIVPHHFILWALPLALACKPTLSTFLAYALVWAFRDLAVWLRPENIYKITFGAANGSYGDRLDDAEYVAEFLKKEKVEQVWVNGMDNNVYLQSMVKPWNLVVPEWMEPFEGQPPKYIIHTAGNVPFDYDGNGYEMAGSSPKGMYILMERK